LSASAKRCDQLKTHTSATVRIAGKNVCVRDGGVWKDCREVLSLGGGDVTLGLEKLIDKEWKKGPPGRVHRTSVRYANRLVVLANWSMGLSSILAAESLSTILFFLERHFSMFSFQHCSGAYSFLVHGRALINR
jgi:hypothetical protein